MVEKPVNCNSTTKEIKDRNANESLFKVSLLDNLDRSKEEYLDRYEGIKPEILDTTRFDENSDLSTTYLGNMDMTYSDNLIVEERFSITEQGYTIDKLLDSTECQILWDTGASKSFLCKSHYLHCETLHSLPKFTSKTQRIQVGNRQYVSVFL